MATHTTYYNLTKPAQNDKVNIGVLNDNADIIDAALHNKVDSDDLTADNVMLSDGVTSVEDALDGLQADIVARDKGIVLKSVNTDGIKTYSQLIDQLYSTISANIDDFASLRIYADLTIFYPSVSYRFFSGLMNSGETSMINRYINVKSSNSVYGQLTANVGATSISASTSNSTIVPQSGYTVRLIKV